MGGGGYLCPVVMNLQSPVYASTNSAGKTVPVLQTNRGIIAVEGTQLELEPTQDRQ